MLDWLRRQRWLMKRLGVHSPSGHYNPAMPCWCMKADHA